MARELKILHFNDVYNIEGSTQEPVGGASRFTSKMKSLAAASSNPPLVLFSGDCFNPSLMSTMTLGKQMVPVLNQMNVAASCVGNHDFDFGLDNFRNLIKDCDFPWLMANVLDKSTGEPLGGVGRTVLLEHQGVKVGIIGLVESDWIECLSTVEPDEVEFLDPVQEGGRLAKELRAQGAELVIALTHMRVPNDIQLATQVAEIDAVLGGHDHHVQVEVLQPHNIIMCKSGTDFKTLTEITVTLPSSSTANSASNDLQQQRPSFKWQTYEITSELPEDEEVSQLVAEYAELLGSRMDEVLTRTLTPLDGQFSTVRTRESNLCNFFCDVFRRACSADVVIMNSGTFRSDMIHPEGDFTYRDLVTVLPMQDDTTVLKVTGQQLLDALENGVSQTPKLEGRFPQVSGIRFSYDPSKPPGSRIVQDTVTVGTDRLPLELQGTYTLATKQYLAEGKDGYDVLVGCPVVMDTEVTPEIGTAVRNYFLMLELLNSLNMTTKVRTFAKRWAQAAKHKDWDRQTYLIKTGNCIKCPKTGDYVIAPAVDGRITCVGEECPAPEPIAEAVATAPVYNDRFILDWDVVHKLDMHACAPPSDWVGDADPPLNLHVCIYGRDGGDKAVQEALQLQNGVVPITNTAVVHLLSGVSG